MTIEKQMVKNPMETEPVAKLLWKNSIPLIFSLMAHNLYNFVDSIFVSRVSEAALTALTMAAPIQALIGALGTGIAVGLNASISKAMGEKDEQKVRDTASAALLLAIVAWLLVAIGYFVGVKPFFAWQSGGNVEIYEAGVSYLRICLLFSIGTLGQWVYDRFLIATGKSTLFLITLSTASIVNLILDPIFIFGWLGLPEMGVEGAAIATVIGQFCGAAAGILINEKKNQEIVARFRLKIPLNSITSILKVGVPASIMQAVVAFSGMMMNVVVGVFSSTAVAVLGVCNRVQGLALLPPHGVNNALLPIISYNLGARKRSRIEDGIRWGFTYSFLLMGVILLVLELFPVQILGLFNASDTMMDMGVIALRILATSYFLSALSMGASTIYQAAGNGNYSLWLTLLRQVVLPLGIAYLFAKTGRLWLVWLAFPLAEILSVPLVLFLFGKIKETVLDDF